MGSGGIGSILSIAPRTTALARGIYAASTFGVRWPTLLPTPCGHCSGLKAARRGPSAAAPGLERGIYAASSFGAVWTIDSFTPFGR